MILALPRFLGPVLLDVVLSEDHMSSMSITENPIEFGADVADHAYIEPKVVRLHAAIGTTRTVGVLHGGFASARVAGSYEALLQLQAQKEPFDVVTGLRLYSNMLIEHIRVYRDHKNAAVLDFDAVLREVIIAESAYAEGAPASEQAANRQGKSTPNAAGKSPQQGETAQRAAGNVQTGQQTPAPVPTNPNTVEGAKGSSMLYQMMGLGQ